MRPRRPTPLLFFFNDTATTEIYTLSLHDALPISHGRSLRGISQRRSLDLSHGCRRRPQRGESSLPVEDAGDIREIDRSEEHTSELQSPCNLVCRLLLEKKNRKSAENVADRAYART